MILIFLALSDKSSVSFEKATALANACTCTEYAEVFRLIFKSFPLVPSLLLSILPITVVPYFTSVPSSEIPSIFKILNTSLFSPLAVVLNVTEPPP